jgi:hypothetical protein
MTSVPRAEVRSRAGSRFLVAAGVGAAAALSVLRKGYQFDGYFADDQFWNALLIDRLDPGALAGDPLVELIGGRYESGLFDAMTALAPVAPLPVLAFAFFAAARLLTCAAIYRITFTLTRSAAAGVVAALLVAGAWIAYFGGLNFVETILTPRGFALPLALFGLDAFLRRRPASMTVWLAGCLYVHPVTGINVLGAVAFCGLVFPDAAPRRSFWTGVLALLALVLLLAFRAEQFAGDGLALRYDDAWAAVIAATVGPWVYLHLLPPAFALAVVWPLLFGGIGVVATGRPELRSAVLRFGLASVAALALHAVAVDWLNLRLLLQLSPQRATLPLTAICVAALAFWITESLRARDPLRRMLAAAFLAAAVLQQDLVVAGLFGGALALVAWLGGERPAPRWRPALAVALVAGISLLAWPALVAGFHFAPERLAPRLALLRSLGVDEDWAAVQQYIREHSQPGDAVMAPAALSPRVFARRPSTLRTKMQSFTHVSRDFAFEFVEWQRDVGLPMQRADTGEALAIARRTPARWLVLDDRATPAAASDPPPGFRAGPYRAYPLAAAPPPAPAGGSAAPANPVDSTR